MPIVRFLWIALLALMLPDSAAAQSSAACSEYVRQLYRTDVRELRALGGGMSARGTGGYRFVAMAPDFNVARHRFGTSHVAGREKFSLRRTGSGPFSGRLHQFFPERGNNDVDSLTLEIDSNGSFFLTYHTWGNTRAQLVNVTCLPGQGGQLLVLSYAPDVGWGSSHWSMVIAPGGR